METNQATYEKWSQGQKNNGYNLNSMARMYIAEVSSRATTPGAGPGAMPTIVNTNVVWNNLMDDMAFYVRRIRGAIFPSRAASTSLTAHIALQQLFSFNVRTQGFTVDWFDTPINFSIFQSFFEVRDEATRSSWVIVPKGSMRVAFSLDLNSAAQIACVIGGADSILLKLWFIGDLVNVGA